MQKLLIVESPNKEKTIQKYLGEVYTVMATNGHIYKLSTTGEGRLGIDLENWEPNYTLEANKKTIVKNLKSAAKKVDEVLIATDPDREGEAIAQNLVDALDIETKYRRVKYNEITKEAIEEAIAHSNLIDQNLVEAQKARRMLDRIIGFKLSKLIKNTVKNSPVVPSAGRVQSIALKLVCDREKEIEEYIPTKYEIIEAIIENDIVAQCYLKPSVMEKNTWLPTKTAEEIMAKKTGKLLVKDYSVNKRNDAAITPYKQSILYKEAKYSSKIVQSAAQKLFETGLITYPRTDSTRLSAKFIAYAQKYISTKYGNEYVASTVKGFSGDQDAHEAIRPTDINLTPAEAVKKYELNNYMANIYTMIYNKTLMALMTPPVRQIYSYELLDNETTYKMSFSKKIFNGYSAIHSDEEDSKKIPEYEIGTYIKVKKYNHEKKQTLPPARYNEGSLIQTLDEIKVGRPSTFATTINIIKKRLFVDSVKKTLIPTDFGKVVCEKLVTNFKKIINEEYTSQVEEDLDNIANGVAEKNNLMNAFWEKFNNTLDIAQQTMEISKLELQNTGEKCELCNSNTVYRYKKSNQQKFIGCSAFPKCKFTKSDPNAPKKRTYFKKSKDNINE
ncbi:type I DNA topoisomerase [Mycoplasma phocoenae]|uniref:DNA topoisomerase 1 n=1 Tax=Mycoplasma phocoenae TaxID=754517 RepID=A0A858U3I4_9MOLU|nr:type I DNA topoisomerase [Mycoplasma phocoenae]QJG67030.1 type I DNA topoisomerase [Mycoplasma phocoenae]